MISVPEPDRYVLFSVEGEDLFSYRLVHVTGNTKLIELPIEEKHVPNIYLSALMISDGVPIRIRSRLLYLRWNDFLTLPSKPIASSTSREKKELSS